MAAAQGGHTETCVELIEQGASVEASSQQGTTALIRPGASSQTLELTGDPLGT